MCGGKIVGVGYTVTVALVVELLLEEQSNSASICTNLSEVAESEVACCFLFKYHAEYGLYQFHFSSISLLVSKV